MMNPLHRFTLAVVARQRGVLDIGRALISCSAPRIAQRECRGRHASSKASQERRKAKALVRARRERNDALNEILDPGKWAGLERTLTKGLRELDSSPERKQRGSQLRKPLVEQQKGDAWARREDDEDEEEEEGVLYSRTMAPHEVWAADVERMWNEVLHADSRRALPQISLPGYPIQVIKVKAARDFGFIRVYWDLDECDPSPPPGLVRQLREMISKGVDIEAVLVKSISQRLERRTGYLRACMAKRLPMRRVPQLEWQHASEMPEHLQDEV